MSPPIAPRDQHGRFLEKACPYEECDGKLVLEEPGWWRCDGLRAPFDGRPMVACKRMHQDGTAPMGPREAEKLARALSLRHA